VSTTATLAPDAAIALGLASTAMPFARAPHEEAERWLRILRLRGDAGAALQAIGVGERPIAPCPQPSERQASSNGYPTEERDSVGRVADEATQVAQHRGSRCVTTTDLLRAVMRVYGPHFDRLLEAHGTDHAELARRLSVQAP
jgi:hypothetical protein